MIRKSWLIGAFSLVMSLTVLAGPEQALAVSLPTAINLTRTDSSICTLAQGGDVCNLGAVDFIIALQNGLPAPAPLLGAKLAAVDVTVRVFDPGTTAGFSNFEFQYEWQISDVQFHPGTGDAFFVTNFLLPLTLNSADVISSGVMPGTGNRIADTAAYVALDNKYSAVWATQPISPFPGFDTSDVMFMRTITDPDAITSQGLGTTNFSNNFLANAEVQAPGSTLSAAAAAPVPEPGILLLLGSGLAGLAATRLARLRSQRVSS